MERASMNGLEAGKLPDAIAYELPTTAPVPRAPWEVAPERAALLIHDVQRYFLRIYPADEDPVAGMLANIAAIRDRCDERGIPVFYTAQTPHREPLDRGLQADLWGPGMGADPSDTDIVDRLTPGSDHVVLRKWRYSAFQRSPLGPMLVARGRDQLIVTGVYARIGCLLTAADAFMRDVEPFFPVDAVADFTRDRHLAATEYVAETCGVTLTTSDLLERL